MTAAPLEHEHFWSLRANGGANELASPPRPDDVLLVLSIVLAAPRDRLGRLDLAIADARTLAAREELRRMAVFFSVPESRDIVHQCAQVASFALTAWRNTRD